jgi:hemin uptake protein HemP
MREPPARPAQPSAESKAPPLRAALPAPRRVLSEQLFGGAVELEIDHHGVVYRLRQTSLGKLILTK